MERLTIDEAIQRENKIAEENQKIVDTEIVFDDVSLSKLYCDDTEVIEEHLENYKKCVEYHKQIAEWLEELKAYKSDEFTKNLQELTYKQGYSRAIADFAKMLKASCREHFVDSDGYFGGISESILYQDDIDEIAEQLKEG